MNKKDDFLIIGITGPFSSGCTTAAKFFETGLSTVKKKYVSLKEKIDADIAEWYNNKNKHNKSRKEIVKLLRRRQFIHALQNIDNVEFYYISMTDVMNNLILRRYFDSYRYKKGKIPDEFSEIVNGIEEWLSKNNELENNLTKIFNYLDNFSFEEAELVFNYLKVDLPKLRDIFHEKFNNDPSLLFKLMQNIGNNLRRVGDPFDSVSEFKNTTFLQILAREAGTIQKYHRKHKKQKSSKDIRTYYVIECLRNPGEVLYFRKRFYEFYLFSIYADEEKRFERAKDKYGFSLEEFKMIDKRDQGGDFTTEQFKQNIKQCVNLADIAITNQDQLYHFYEKLLQYYALIKFPGCVKPTRMERYMNLAYSMSLNSTCICRQVGAVIVKDDQVIGAGWNDTEPGRIGCIYRLRSDLQRTNNTSFPICSQEDYNDFKKIILNYENLDHSFCYKDEYGKFKKEKEKSESIDPNCKEIIDKLEMRSLQQCRALHAEENAILQTSHLGGIGLNGSTIYTTTFPCELCAKKICRVGIKKIVYCEPYPKSVSMDVFLKEGISEIKMIPFEGVKSPSFFRLFKPNLDIKDLQKIELMDLNNS